MTRFAPLLLVLLLAACAGTVTHDDHLLPPGSTRQGELTRLYDTMGVENDKIGNDAARKVAAGDDRDHRFMASLWGTRARSSVGARRLGQALSDGGHHELAFDWFERAFLELEGEHELLPWLRYEMALESYALGNKEDTVNLLSNRMGTTPLPAELKPKYAALLERAAR